MQSPLTVCAVATEHASDEDNRLVMNHGVLTILSKLYIYPTHVEGVLAVQQLSR